MHRVVEEFQRLSGVAPSFLERTAADPMLGVLAKAFSVKSLVPGDIKYLMYRKVGHGVELEDKAARFGGILTSVEPRDADPKTLVNFLKKHGAKPAPRVESLEESADAAEFFKIGHPKVDSAIKWLLSKSKKKTLPDGTVSYFFHGKLPVGMVRSIVRQKGVWKWTKDAGSEWGCGWERPDGEGSFSFWHGAKKSTEGRVRFTANDYRVLAAAAKKESLDESVTKTILKQMGGAGRLKAMIGAKHFIDHGGALSFQFPNRKRSKGNYVKVTLRADDTYDMEFSTITHGGTKVKPVKTYSGIMFDQLIPLFEKQTGLYLRL